MSFLTSWLLSVISVAFLVSIAETLMPDKRVREVGHMVGGLLLLLALLQPLLEVRLPDGGAWSFDKYFARISQREEAYQRNRDETLNALIKEQSETYIEDKAKELGLSVRAEVTLQSGEEGVPRVASVTLDIPYNAELSRVIAQDLDTAEDRQIWRTKETG